MATSLTIDRLEEVVASLAARERELFRRIYALTVATGEQTIPRSMQPWVKQQFGSLAAVTRQKVVKLTNVVTGEEALFNRLRALRPVDFNDKEGLVARLGKAPDNDLFRSPETSTPEDVFGRVAGKHCITASNVAKYDGLHGLVIFNDFNPLRFSREQVIDYIDVGCEWARRGQAIRPEARYFFFVWNCLGRAGASILHGHAQVMLTSGRHYARIEGLRRAALSYRESYGSNYFTDLYRVHHRLGCAVEKMGVRVLAYLTPFKDNEIVLMADELNLSLKERIYEVLALFRDRLGVASFNLGLVTLPLAETEESWEGFPVTARLVDRGDPGGQASDVGSMEIYGASVVSSDPFVLARKLKQYLG